MARGIPGFTDGGIDAGVAEWARSPVIAPNVSHANYLVCLAQMPR